MECLYKTDYGPADPGFNPLASNGRLVKGFEAHLSVLTQAKNLGQLEAMERKLARGAMVQWCDQGYGWTYGPAPTDFFYLILFFLILPWLARRVLPPVKRRLAAGPETTP